MILIDFLPSKDPGYFRIQEAEKSRNLWIQIRIRNTVNPISFDILTLVIDDKKLIPLMNGLPNLQFLSLQNCINITGKGMKNIKEPLRKMEIVDLYATEIKDAGLRLPDTIYQISG